MKKRISNHCERPGTLIIPQTPALTTELIEKIANNPCRSTHFQLLDSTYDVHENEYTSKFRYIIPGGLKMVEIYVEAKMIVIQLLPGAPFGPLIPGQVDIDWREVNDEDGNLISRKKMGECKTQGTFEITLPLSGLEELSVFRLMVKLFCCDSKEYEIRQVHGETNFRHLEEIHAEH